MAQEEKYLGSTGTPVLIELIKSIFATKESVESKSDKPIEKSVTLTATEWLGEVVPYRIEVSVEEITENSKVDVIPKYDWSDEQVNTWMSAQIMNGDTQTGKLLLKAYGVKPTVDIPLTLYITEN